MGLCEFALQLDQWVSSENKLSVLHIVRALIFVVPCEAVNIRDGLRKIDCLDFVLHS